MIRFIYVVMFVMVCASATLAETSVTPMASYDYMDVDNQTQSAAGGGFIVESGSRLESDYLFASLLYKNYQYAEELDFGHPDEFHSINAMFNYKRGAHEILAVVASDSADPFENKYTFQAGVAYGYSFVQSERFALVLGGGVAGGGGYDIIPVPYILAEYNADMLSASFSMITNPSLELVLMPQNKLSLLLNANAAGFDEAEYILFTAALQYDMDFMKISAGVKNDGYEFDSKEEDTAFFMQAYSAFAELDFGYIKLGGGYVFDSKEIYTNDGDVTKQDAGTGYYVSAQAMFPF